MREERQMSEQLCNVVTSIELRDLYWQARQHSAWRLADEALNDMILEAEYIAEASQVRLAYDVKELMNGEVTILG